MDSEGKNVQGKLRTLLAEKTEADSLLLKNMQLHFGVQERKEEKRKPGEGRRGDRTEKKNQMLPSTK